MKKLLLILLCLPIIGFGQCILGDCVNGYGTYTWSDGAKYLGGFQNGEFHGKGTYTYENGNEYVGGWKEGKFHGQGTFTFPNGDKYVGEYKNDFKHGQGTYTSISGEVYSGQYFKGKRHGKGTFSKGLNSLRLTLGALSNELSFGEELVFCSTLFAPSKGLLGV